MTQIIATKAEKDTLALERYSTDAKHHALAQAEHKSKQKTRPVLAWVGWIATIALSFAAGRYLLVDSSQSGSKIHLQEVSSSKQSTDLVSVTSTPIQMRPLQRTVSAVGTLHGYEELTISSKIEGRVLHVHHDLAHIVRPGELLLELDPTDATLSVNQAEKSLLAELAKWGFKQVPTETEDLSQLPSVVSAKHRFDLSRSQLNRMTQLELSKSISAEDLEQVKSETRVLESDWKNQLLLAQSAAATARLRAADLEIAKQRLRDCEIRVPSPTLQYHPDQNYYSISERLVSEGTMLRSGTELFRLVLGRTLKLRLSVPESFASKIEVGQSVKVMAASAPETQMGKVTKISPAIDRATRTFQVEVEVPNALGACKPGGFAKAEILVGEQEDAITVPMSAIYSLAGIHKLFVLQEDIVKELHVTLGEPTANWIEVVSPRLSADTVVITSGQRLLSDGVRVNNRTFAANNPSAEKLEDSPAVPMQSESTSIKRSDENSAASSAISAGAKL